MTATGYVSTTGDTRKVSKSGDTMTGELTLPDSSPDQALNAASKGYVDSQTALKASLTGATFTGAVTVSNAALNVTGYTTLAGGQANSNWAIFGNLSAFGTGKAYRFRTDGSNLDLEATGVDLLVSNWSGTNFDGTQRSYDRYSANAMNVQHAGKREYVTALYGSAVHTIDATAGTASFGGKNGLTAIRLAGFKATAGAPTTGTWASGDVVLDSAGAWHLCTASGTPGSWT